METMLIRRCDCCNQLKVTVKIPMQTHWLCAVCLFRYFTDVNDPTNFFSTLAD